MGVHPGKVGYAATLIPWHCAYLSCDPNIFISWGKKRKGTPMNLNCPYLTNGLPRVCPQLIETSSNDQFYFSTQPRCRGRTCTGRPAYPQQLHLLTALVPVVLRSGVGNRDLVSAAALCQVVMTSPMST